MSDTIVVITSTPSAHDKRHRGATSRGRITFGTGSVRQASAGRRVIYDHFLQDGGGG